MSLTARSVFIVRLVDVFRKSGGTTKDY